MTRGRWQRPQFNLGQVTLEGRRTVSEHCGHVKLSLLNSAGNKELPDRMVEVSTRATLSAGSDFVNPSIQNIRTKFIKKGSYILGYMIY